MTLQAMKRCVLALMLVTAVACGAVAQTVVSHMHYANHAAPWHEWLQERALAFERLNPDIKIDLFVSTDGTGVNQLLAMGAGGTVPDVTELALVHGGTLAGMGFFRDLRPYIARDRLDTRMFPPVALEAVTWSNGELWGIPADLYVAPVFFNVDMYAEGGLANPNELGEAWTWDTLIEVGRKLSQDTNFDGHFDRKAITGWGGMWSHLAVVRQAGGLLFDRYKDPTESRFNTPEVEVAIQYLVDLYRTHGVLEDGHSGLTDGTSAVTLISGPTAITTLNELGVNFDVALQPKGPASRASYSVTASFQMPKGNKNPEAAWKWIKFLATETESMRNFVAKTSRLPAFLPVARNYQRFVIDPPKNIGLILESVLDPAAFHLPLGPLAKDALACLSTRRTQLMRGEIDVRSFLEDAHQRATAILSAR
ncbi:MAG: extracellular solute-binding protein [Firmicutes bacterium]|jgi:multiple sugar transport system substrate-binding protein|nr:extracellular solute-binding protein [Bacillota bacterium]